MLVGMPPIYKTIINDAVQGEYITKVPQVHIMMVTLSAQELRHQVLMDRSQPYVRLNFAPHAYLYPDAKFGEEIKEDVVAAIYTVQGKKIIDSELRGLQSCQDFGRIHINPEKFFLKSNQQEVHIHLADHHSTAVSPNNGAFLLNLAMPLVNFHVALYELKHKQLSLFK